MRLIATKAVHVYEHVHVNDHVFVDVDVLVDVDVVFKSNNGVKQAPENVKLPAGTGKRLIPDMATRSSYLRRLALSEYMKII